jgi:tetratricopeptide (TPR) repeat protein
LAELSIDCPVCGKQNSLPVDHADDTFKCVGCGQTSPLDSAAISGTEKAPDYLVGETISDCKILEKVGEGGFGSVYKATDQNLQRIVAFKVMLQSLTTNAEFVQKFIREAVTAAQLNHPNIVAIHKVGRDERRGLHYLIMEFVEGRTLADIVKEKGVLKVDEAVPIMIQACDALATAHEHSIVHRDIKPENLMLDKSGVLKITDFGLAKSISTDNKSTKVMGTPHYMSPEQFEGKAVDGRSDVYSLGVTFYYLLSKGRPYEGQNTVQIIYAILTQQPKALPDLNRDVPPEVWTIIQKMIAKKTEDRYQSLRETIVELRRYQDRTQADKSQCPSCGAKNPKGRKFCRGCGAALVVKCPSCAAESPAGAATCTACGADMGRLLKIKKSMEAASRFKSLGDLRRAAESYRQVVEIDPTHGEAKAEYDRLAGTLTDIDRVKTEADDLMKTGDLESALGRVEDLLRRFPMAAEVREHRDDLKTSLTRRKVDRLLEEADRSAASAGVREAVDLLDQALRADPAREDVRARREELAKRLAQVAESRQRAAKALAAGRFEEAFGLASEVLKITPGDKAMEDVRRKAQTSVDSVDQFVKRGKDHAAARRLEDALAEFEAALSLRPGDAELYGLVESTRGRIAEQRERIAQCRRLMADREFGEAAKGLEAVLAELPDDAEAKSLLAACEKGREEVARAKSIEQALKEGDRLEKEGDFAAARDQFDRVLKLDPKNPDAGPRRDQVEQKMRGERDIRELANEHLQDGRYADAISALERLKATNPARASAVEAEVAECRRREGEVKGALKRAEEALSRKEYRRAQSEAAAVLAKAPRHPRATAIKKDADKAIAAIDRFLAECDKLLLSEMFDEALEALDKAKERGAGPDEYKPRRESCEQGRLTLLKTDATRSLVAKDYEAAIAAYDQVLEVSKSDSDALQGKRSAERRIRILTTEPMALRLGAAAAVLLLLGVVQITAVAATSKVAATATDVESAAVTHANQTAGEERGKHQLEPDVGAAVAAEDAGDYANAKAAYEGEQAKGFADRPELVSGAQFADAMAAAMSKTAPPERIDALAAASQYAGDAPERRRLREQTIARARDAALGEWIAIAEKLEATDADHAMNLYGDIQAKAPESPAVSRAALQMDYLDKVRLGDQRAKGSDWKRAAEAYLEARAKVVADARRRQNVDNGLTALRAKWLDSVRAASAAAGGDEEKWYASVVPELERVARTYEPLGVTRQTVLDEYRKAGGR